MSMFSDKNDFLPVRYLNIV